MKKIISLLLVFFMILTPILAIGPLDIPNIFDIFSLPIFAEGYTPEGTAISDAAGLSAVQEGQKYYLTNTIIIDENYTPISVAGVTIDGKDENGTVHTIQFGSDVNVGVTNKGLFTSTTLIDGVTIKNVNLTGKLISNDANALHVSPIFYSTTSDSGFQGKVTLSNIKCGVSVHADSAGYLAGLLTRANGNNLNFTAENIEILENTKLSNSGESGIGYTSGMFCAIESWAQGTVTLFDNCVNNGYIEISGKRWQTSATTFIGMSRISGLLGKIGGHTGAENTIIIRNCANNANMQIGLDGKETDILQVGGLAYQVWGWDVTIDNCKNTGNITNPFNILVNPEDGTTQYKYSDAYTVKTAGAVAGLITRVADIHGEVVISNCENRGNILVGISEASRESGISGVFSVLGNVENATIRNCYNYGNITVEDCRGNIGGLIATSYSYRNNDNTAGTADDNIYYDHNLTMIDCENHGNITFNRLTQTQNVGIAGLVGMVENQHDDDFNNKTGDTDAYVGEGSSSSYDVNETYFINCRNKGSIKVEKHATQANGDGNIDAMHIGGIAGRCIALKHMEFRHCINEGEIYIRDLRNDAAYGWTDTGGIVGGFMTLGIAWDWSGISEATFNIIDCHNVAPITGFMASGILGATWQINDTCDTKVNIEGCSNYGTITSEALGRSGGIIGGIDQAGGNYGAATKLNVKECLNYGDVTGGITAGGILGGCNVDSLTNVSKPLSITDCSVRVSTIRTTTTSTENTRGSAGGIIGVYAGALTLTGCSIWGNISGRITGGLVAASSEGLNGGTAGTITSLDNYYYVGASALNTTCTVTGLNDEASVNSKFTTNVDKTFADTANIGAGRYTYAPATHTKYIVHEYQLFKANKDSTTLVLARNNINFTSLTNGKTIDATNITLDGEDRTVILNGAEYIFSKLITSTVKNLTITTGANGITYDGDIYLGPLAEQATGSTTIENVTSNVTITVNPSKDLNVGGVIGVISTGAGTTAFKNVKFGGTINYFANATVGADGGGLIGNVGGLTASAMGNVTFEDCTSAGTIKSQGLSTTTKLVNTACGGLVGSAEINVNLKNCNSSTKINVEDNDTCVGGIVGHMYVTKGTDKVVIDSCNNTGAINSHRSAGIIAGVCFSNHGIDANGPTLEVYNSYKDATLTVDKCNNSASITGVRIAGGIAGDLTDDINYVKSCGGSDPADQLAVEAACPRLHNITISNCLNTGAVASSTTNSVSYAGGILAQIILATVRNCINTGNVTGKDRAAGIVGNKHTVDTTGALVIEDCKNTGNITASLNYAAGIVSYIWKGKAYISGCVNTGTVRSNGAGLAVPLVSGGIVGFIEDGHEYYTYAESKELGIEVEIEKCVNAGSIELKSTAARATDAWVCVGGIVGMSRLGISVKECVHVGNLETNADAATPNRYGTYPILNAGEFPVATTHELYQKDPTLWKVYSDNYYSEGSALQDAALYKMSTLADAATLEAAIRNTNVYVFDRTYANDEIELGTKIENGTIAKPPYTAEQETTLYKEIDEAEAVRDDTANIWARQSVVFDAEHELRDAIYAYDSSSEKYTVIIPEKGYGAVDFAYDINVKVENFTYFSTLKLEAESKNDFRLVDGANSMIYQILDGNDLAYGQNNKKITLIDYAPKKNVSETITAVIKPVILSGQENKPSGTYRDRLSFIVTYSDGKPTE